jgi:hypothetical protein
MTRDRAWKGFRIAISAAAITGALAGARILRAQTAPAAWKIHQRSFTLAANQTAEEWLENVIPAEVLKDHGSFAEKALLMRGTDVVDSADFQSDPAYPNSGSWSFTSVMDRAFRLSGASPAAVEGNIQKWGKNLDPDISPLTEVWKAAGKDLPVPKIPLRLLAVVNRIDLATMNGCGPGRIGKAEVRFVYAGIPPPSSDPFFTGIVEFILPCMSKADFHTMGQEWISLASEPSATYLRRLECILDRRTAQAASVRVRVNGEAPGGPWYLGQFAVSAQGLVRQQPDRQANYVLNDCVDRDPCFNHFVRSHAKNIRNSNYSFTGQSFATNFGMLYHTPPSVLTLANVIGNPVKTDGIRFSLSINSCTGCHGWETVRSGSDSATPFDHVKYRVQCRRSLLSNFLTGTETGNPGIGLWTVGQPPVLSECSPPKASARNYNDLLRRHLYLYILNSLSPNDSDRVWINALKRSELTAGEEH